MCIIMRVICLRMMFFSFSALLSPFCHKISPLSRFKKKILSLAKTTIFSSTIYTQISHNTKFSPLFLSFDEDRLHNTEENRSSLLLSHYTTVYTYKHITRYEFAKRAITTAFGSVRTEPATSSWDFNHKGSFSKSFFKEREKERRE